MWRASRPKPGKELDDYKTRCSQRAWCARPKLELYVGNADGTDADAGHVPRRGVVRAVLASPTQKRILFSSNYGDPKGREFDIWAINIDGTGLERITYAPGFDGFPMFSPDGKTLAFSSNRASRPGTWDTNLFTTSWIETPPAGPAQATSSTP